MHLQSGREECRLDDLNVVVVKLCVVSCLSSLLDLLRGHDMRECARRGRCSFGQSMLGKEEGALCVASTVVQCSMKVKGISPHESHAGDLSLNVSNCVGIFEERGKPD